MFKIEVKGIQAAQASLDAELRSEISRLAGDVFKEVQARTPVDTGRARRGWKKSVDDQGFAITNAVPYVPVLDRGRHMTNRGIRGSRQAPKGIVGPSLDAVKRKN